MSEMPVNIWAGYDPKESFDQLWEPAPDNLLPTKYIRADIADELAAQLRTARAMLPNGYGTVKLPETLQMLIDQIDAALTKYEESK